MLERLTRSSPDDPTLLLMYGDGLVEHQELDRAIPVLEAAVKADGASLPAQASLGRAYVQAGRYAEAVPHLETAAADDENGDVHLQLARAYRGCSGPTRHETRWPNIEATSQEAAEPRLTGRKKP